MSAIAKLRTQLIGQQRALEKQILQFIGYGTSGDERLRFRCSSRWSGYSLLRRARRSCRTPGTRRRNQPRFTGCKKVFGSTVLEPEVPIIHRAEKGHSSNLKGHIKLIPKVKG
ncbi:hypothetical protein Y1Q_0024607 [Alligator mississippiensis]|uniref:Uncharacterized protein n=1 Tax=Alligator mississippiensis TaxID=8496 RepID=A0A151NB76_ALLMI|nr:hypothetical protein Y1Q_0024607 [Alligator mississippiensis]